MKLADVKFFEENGRLYVGRMNKRDKVNQKIDVTVDVINWIVDNVETSSFKKDGKTYLLAVREADKEQLAMMKLSDADF